MSNKERLLKNFFIFGLRKHFNVSELGELFFCFADSKNVLALIVKEFYRMVTHLWSTVVYCIMYMYNLQT